MSSATTTTSGHVARAIRLFNEPELFVGVAIQNAWADELNPDVADPTAITIGRISGQTYGGGGSLASSNAYATLNVAPFVGGVKTYLVRALTGTTFEVRDTSNNSLVGNTSYTRQAGAFTTIIQGVSLYVTSGTMTAGDTFTFTVDGPVGFKAVTTKYLVVPDSSGTISYRGQNWLIVSPTNAYTAGARWVYIQATMSYDEIPIANFRQIGVFTGLTRAGGVSNSVLALTPSQVATTGALEVIDNRTVISRNISQAENYSFILAN